MSALHPLWFGLQLDRCADTDIDMSFTRAAPKAPPRKPIGVLLARRAPMLRGMTGACRAETQPEVGPNRAVAGTPSGRQPGSGSIDGPQRRRARRGGAGRAEGRAVEHEVDALAGPDHPGGLCAATSSAMISPVGTQTGTMTLVQATATGSSLIWVV